MDTKAKLEQAHKGNVTCSDVRNALTNAQTLLTDYVNHICNCLPEAEKPELRHLDYGLDKDGEVRIILERYENTDLVYAGEACLQSMKKGYECPTFIETHLGNLFDDLKAMSEDLTEFGRSDLGGDAGAGHNSFKFRISGPHIDYIGDKYACFSQKEISALIRNLQQLVATCKRGKNG